MQHGGLTIVSKKLRAFCKTLQMVLSLKDAGSLHSLRHGTLAEGYAVRRSYESAVQVLEVRKDHHRGYQAECGFHRGDVSASLVCADG